jgi:hypothetical protein
VVQVVPQDLQVQVVLLPLTVHLVLQVFQELQVFHLMVLVVLVVVHLITNLTT